MADIAITTELQEIQNNLWGTNVRENIALALEKLQNLPEEPNTIQGSLKNSKLSLLKVSIQNMENTLQSRKDQLDRIKARLEQASGRTILQYGKCGNDLY